MQPGPSTAEAIHREQRAAEQDEAPRDSGLRLGDSIRSERLSMVFGQSIVAVFLSPLVAGVMAMALWDAVSRLRLLVWFGGLVTLGGLRYALVRAFMRRPQGGQRVVVWERAFVGSVVFVALWWGVGSMFLLTDAESKNLLVFCFLMLMASGSAASYTAHPLTVSITTLALAAPITVHFALQDSAVHRALAFGAFVYVAASFRSIRALSEFFARTHRLAHDLERERNRAEHLARIDHLTSLNNRRAFYELSEAAMRHAARYGHPASLIMLDIDHFKVINDRLGHAAGDEVLRVLAGLMRSHFRCADIPCRFGGEEFAIFLPETNLEDAVCTGERLRSLIESQTLTFSGQALQVTASIGVAALEHASTLDELVSRADAALYEAKRRGRNSVVPDSGERTPDASPPAGALPSATGRARVQ